MAKQQRQPFSPSGEFVAAKEFRFAGKTYAVGDSFPWRKLSCSMRRLIQLYEGRYIDVAGQEVEEEIIEEEEGLENETEANTPESEEDESEEDEPEEDESEEDESEEDEPEEGTVFTFDPEIHEIVSPARGEYEIRLDGETLYTVDKKLAKKLKKVTKPTEIRIGE